MLHEKDVSAAKEIVLLPCDSDDENDSDCGIGSRTKHITHHNAHHRSHHPNNNSPSIENQHPNHNVMSIDSVLTTKCHSLMKMNTLLVEVDDDVEDYVNVVAIVVLLVK